MQVPQLSDIIRMHKDCGGQTVTSTGPQLDQERPGLCLLSTETAHMAGLLAQPCSLAVG